MLKDRADLVRRSKIGKYKIQARKAAYCAFSAECSDQSIKKHNERIVIVK